MTEPVQACLRTFTFVKIFFEEKSAEVQMVSGRFLLQASKDTFIYGTKKDYFIYVFVQNPSSKANFILYIYRVFQKMNSKFVALSQIFPEASMKYFSRK